MFPRVFPLLTLLIAASRFGPAQQPTQSGQDSYRGLRARLEAKDTTIDFTALRLALTKSADYAPYGSAADAYEDSLGAALRRNDFRRAVTEADSALAIDYLDVRTHVLRAYAADRLGDSSAARWDQADAALLVRSIEQSGAGTVDSPYVVISVREEYALLGMSGYESDRQSLGKCGTRLCDILEARSRAAGVKRTFYFDISLPKAFIDRLFQSK